MRVQCAKGLIHQHDWGAGGQCAQHADTLLLSARKLSWIFVAVRFHAHQLQHILHDLIAALLIIIQQLWHHADVLGHRHVGKQADLLDHIADMAAQLHLIGLCNILTIDINMAAVRLDQTIDGFQRCSFSAAGRADQHNKLSVRDREIQIVQDQIFAIGFIHMLKLDHRGYGSFPMVYYHTPQVVFSANPVETGKSGLLFCFAAGNAGRFTLLPVTNFCTIIPFFTQKVMNNF